MKILLRSLVTALATFAFVAPISKSAAQAAEGAQQQVPLTYPSAAELKKINAQMAPVDLVADVSKLPENERHALAKIIEAAKLMDPLFLRQVWAGNEAMLLDLLGDTSALGKVRLEAFLLNKGPWDRLDHNRPLIPGAPPKPEQANFFTADSKAEVERWVATLKPEQKAAATGFFTTIRKDENGKFVIVPYSVEYQGELAHAAQLLREAAQLTVQPTLKKFLEARAAAFLTNDYYASDVAWMQLDASIEPTIGPYEVYEDEWFNQKAAFESFITLRDDAETAKLQRLSAELQELENNLPIDPKYRNPKLGALAPIRVVNSIYSSGDGNRGVQTAAYNLPNDERIAKEMGTKRVMLRNVQQAKFQKVLIPISKIALSSADSRDVDFDAFFTYILMHELMHGLGPHNITVNGQQTTVRQAFQDTYSAIEEAKADVTGMWALAQLTDKGVLDKKFERTMYVTYLASCFRSIRFGTSEAHGKGTALQLNYLLDKGAVVVKPNGTFAIEPKKIRQAMTDLAHDLLTWEAEGNRAGAQAALDKLGVVRPEVAKVLKKLDRVPVDIKPRFVTAEKILREFNTPRK
ncbi:MAG: hypothetical protein IRZ16_15415 [Myxococcaceae bacterium]|nr:hypothetical protein [Myxococcaceae bacterium]